MKTFKLSIKKGLALAVLAFKQNFNFSSLTSFMGWGIIAIATIPFISYPLQYGLDPSWTFFINKYHYFLANNPYKFGLDVFFTYGPLGFILYPIFGQPTYLIAIFVQFLFWLLWLVLLFKLTNQESVQGSRLFIFIFSFLFLFANNSNIFILAFLLIILLIIKAPLYNFHYLIMALLTTCLMVYMKFSIGILFSSILFSLYLLLFIKKIWKIKSKYTAAYLFFSIVVLPAIYLIYSPSIKGLFQHFYYSLEISSGYSAAMSVRSVFSLLLLSISYILLYIIVSIYLFKNREETFEASLIFIPGLFFSFKSGFVRQDIWHYIDFFNFYIISIALLYLATRKTQAVRVLAGTLILTSLFTGLIFFRGSLIANINYSLISSFNRLINISQVTQQIKPDDLGEMQGPVLDINIKQIIGNNVVVVIPYNLLIAPYNGLQISPMPVIQNYAAFTHKLDKLDSDFIENTRRNQFILFEFESIDGRNPFTDTPMLWQSILRWYDVRYRTEKFLLLERRSEPKLTKIIKIHSVLASKNDVIYVPQNDNLVIAKIDMKYSLLGQIENLFYQAPPINLKVSRENGEEFIVRVIPSTLHNGIFINSFPTNLEESHALFELGSLDRTSCFQFIEYGTHGIDPELQIDFYEMLDE